VLQRLRDNGGITEEVKQVVDDPFTGFAALTQVFAGEDVYLFQTRRYRWLRKHYHKNKWSLLEFMLKVWDHLFIKM
jgi:hypothetical protein